ncbi:MAG: B12-binding domain-containing radical SAM protein [Nanoarchaeota archaeon]|nr:B12-binding domain-containing radical SAM protein [Nanoarchaeota archaeon]
MKTSKTILLVHPPFCTPASPSYALSNLYSRLRENCSSKAFEIKALDLNIEFHEKKYPEFQRYAKNFLKNYNPEEYNLKTKEFFSHTKEDYAKSNKDVVKGLKPNLFDEMLSIILACKPDFVAFSVIYASQAFYTYALLGELKKRNIFTIIGGPAVNELLKKTADKTMESEFEMLEFFKDVSQKQDGSACLNATVPDFSIWDEKKYFTPEIVIPVKTSTSCYYKQCAFCSHYSSREYAEYSLEEIEALVKIRKNGLVFIVDDMIKKERLVEISKIFAKCKIAWTCQLKPTKEFDAATLKTLSDSGLKMIIWGVESGSDRILKLMNKGTNIKDIKEVLSESKKAGIVNCCYILLGFPTETEEGFMQTIDFIKDRSEDIDLILTSVFGLQKNTPVYNNPSKFGITKIAESERTILDNKITYETERGLSNFEAKKLRQKYKKSLEKLNKYPKSMNFFREHMLCLIKSKSD